LQTPELHKRLLSYLYPIRIKSGGSADNAVLELYYYRGQWQLATIDALYSDGYRYRPLLVAYRHLKDRLPLLKQVLVLGTGLGSAVQIMNKMGYQPHFTLVDIDKVVLQWALEILGQRSPQQLTPVCIDARQFVETAACIYDLLIIDIFSGRVVPAFVTSTDFLQKCRRSVAPGGHLVFNYIVNDEKKWEALQVIINDVFPQHKIKILGINRIIIASV
jgi:spermidine synthase